MKKFVYYGFTEAEYNQAKEQIASSNTKNIRIAVRLAVVSSLVCSIVAFLGYLPEECKYIIPIATLVFLAIGLVLRYTRLIVLRETLAVYILMGIICVYTALLTLMFDSIAFLMTLAVMPMLFIDNPVRMYIYNSLFIIGTCVLLAVFSDVGAIDIVMISRTLICGLIGFVFHYVAGRRLIGKASFEIAKEIAIMGRLDEMTGLDEKFTFIDKCESYIGNNSNEAVFGVLDIDGMVAINETYGYITGDWVISTTADILKKHLRRCDILGRTGTDEFAFLLKDVNDTETTLNIVNRLLEALKASEHGDFKEIKASVGLVILDGETTYAEIREKADGALDKAKLSGTKRYEFFIVGGQP